MAQISMYDVPSARLETYEDIDELLASMQEREADAEYYSHKDISSCRTYFFYGTKVFEFYPKKKSDAKVKIKVAPEVLTIMGQEPKTQSFKAINLENDEDYAAFIQALKERKSYLFRHLITHTFACCNDFNRCSDAGRCIHQDEVFYNGCTYRQNLEQGKIFFGQNRNID